MNSSRILIVGARRGMGPVFLLLIHFLRHHLIHFFLLLKIGENLVGALLLIRSIRLSSFVAIMML